MDVINHASAHEYVNSWVRGEGMGFGVSKRSNAGRFYRAAQERQELARSCESVGQMQRAEAFWEAARVLACAALDAETR